MDALEEALLQVGKLGPSAREGSCQGLGSFLW
jgi:hypothetical protein